MLNAGALPASFLFCPPSSSGRGDFDTKGFTMSDTEAKKKVKKLIINLEGDEIDQYEKVEAETPGMTAKGRFLYLMANRKKPRKP